MEIRIEMEVAIRLFSELVHQGTKSGLPFVPAVCTTLGLIGLAFIASIIFPNDNSHPMYKTNINRSVNGDPADPTSTRDLTGISHEELTFLKLAILSAIAEARVFQVVDDDTMRLLLGNAATVSQQYDFPTPDPDELDLDETREYFQERIQHSEDLLAKLEALPQAETYEVTGITPKQFEHLVTSIQAAVREATVYADLTPDQAKLGQLQVKAMYQAWGLTAPEHYDDYRNDLPTYGQRRAEVLMEVLAVVNQFYPGYGPEDIALADSAG